MIWEASQIVGNIAGDGGQAPLNRVHVDVSDEMEEEATEAFEDVIDNEACLASDVLELLNNQHIDDDEPSSDHFNYQVDSPTPFSTAVSLPMIERDLWVSNSNPVCIYTP